MAGSCGRPGLFHGPSRRAFVRRLLRAAKTVLVQTRAFPHRVDVEVERAIPRAAGNSGVAARRAEIAALVLADARNISANLPFAPADGGPRPGECGAGKGRTQRGPHRVAQGPDGFGRGIRPDRTPPPGVEIIPGRESAGAGGGGADSRPRPGPWTGRSHPVGWRTPGR